MFLLVRPVQVPLLAPTAEPQSVLLVSVVPSPWHLPSLRASSHSPPAGVGYELASLGTSHILLSASDY